MNKQHVTLLLYTAGGLLGVAGIIFYAQFLSVKAKAVREANKQWKDWGEQKIDINNRIVKSGAKENTSGYAERVNEYWKQGVGLNYTGYDRDVAWSSAFMSYIWKKAGAKDKFVYSSSHSDYIRDSISNRKNNDFSKPFIGLKLNEYAPKVGDIIVYSREDADNLYNANGSYKSHGDIVVNKGKNFIEVIGGNVDQAVTKKVLATDDKGYLIDNNHKWFAVLKSNL